MKIETITFETRAIVTFDDGSQKVIENLGLKIDEEEKQRWTDMYGRNR